MESPSGTVTETPFPVSEMLLLCWARMLTVLFSSVALAVMPVDRAASAPSLTRTSEFSPVMVRSRSAGAPVCNSCQSWA